MEPIFYCYPRCSTCKKAENFLEEKHIPYKKINIKTNPPSFDLLKELFKNSNLPIKKLFNTSGQAYRKENLKDKLNTLSSEDALKLLSENGMLIKRPLLIYNNSFVNGFKKEQWEDFIKDNGI